MAWTTARQWQDNLEGDLWAAVQAERVPATLSAVYGDATWREVFKTWLVGEFSTENLAFLEAVDGWKGGGGGSARDIYQTFVRNNAPQQVNISAQQRSTIDTAFGTAGAPASTFFDDDVSADVFDEARIEVWNLVSSDSFTRFRAELGTVQDSMPALDGVPQSGGRSRAMAMDEDNDPGPLPEVPQQEPPPVPPNAPDEDVDPNEEDEGPLPQLPADEADDVAEEPMAEYEAADLWEPVSGDGNLAFLAYPEEATDVGGDTDTYYQDEAPPHEEHHELTEATEWGAE